MTFYALMLARSAGTGDGGDGQPVERWDVQISALSKVDATAQMGALRVDVSSLSYAPVTDTGPDMFVFNGPRPPVPDWGPPADFNDPAASGVANLVSHSTLAYPWQGNTEMVQITFDFEEWPPELPARGFIFEYEATTEFLYAESDFNGRACAWMWPSQWQQMIELTSYNADGLGLSAFKIYTLGNGGEQPQPPEPFWADILKCTETL